MGELDAMFLRKPGDISVFQSSNRNGEQYSSIFEPFLSQRALRIFPNKISRHTLTTLEDTLRQR